MDAKHLILLVAVFGAMLALTTAASSEAPGGSEDPGNNNNPTTEAGNGAAFLALPSILLASCLALVRLFQ